MAGFNNIAPADVFEVDNSEKVEDVIDRLPPHAQKIIETIQRGDRAVAEFREGRIREMQRLREKIHEMQRNIGLADREGVPRDARQYQRWQNTIAKCRAKNAALEEAKYPDRLSMTAVERWVLKLPANATFRAATTPLPKGDVAANLEKILAARADFLEQRRYITNAPLTREEARAAMEREIDRLAVNGRPNVNALFRRSADLTGRRRQGSIKWPSHALFIDGNKHTEFDVLPILAWLCKRQLIDALDELFVEPETTMPLAGRDAAIAEVDSYLRKLEFEEAALYCAADDLPALNVERRHDLSVEAALQIEVIVPADISAADMHAAWAAFRQRDERAAESAAFFKRFEIAGEGDIARVDPDRRAEFLEACSAE